MNGRILHDQTPEGRIAAVARSLSIQMQEKRKREPDYADFRDALRPFIEREILLARIDEARKTHGSVLTARVRELAQKLVDLKIPDDFAL